MADPTPNAQLIAWLEDRGHSSEEIAKVLGKVEEYDRQTVHESVFDSIQNGKFDLGTIIREALDEGDDSDAAS